MPFASINSTNPRTNQCNFHEKILDFFLLHLNENKQPVHMRCHLFLHYGWFLQNLGKEAVRTNMHTTVIFTKYLCTYFSTVYRLFLIRLTHYILQLNQNLNEPNQRIRISNLGFVMNRCRQKWARLHVPNLYDKPNGESKWT